MPFFISNVKLDFLIQKRVADLLDHRLKCQEKHSSMDESTQEVVGYDPRKVISLSYSSLFIPHLKLRGACSKCGVVYEKWHTVSSDSIQDQNRVSQWEREHPVEKK